MTPDEIFQFIKSDGYVLPQAVSVALGLYRKRISNLLELPALSKKLKILLDNEFIPGVFAPETYETSVDSTVKYLFRTKEGKKFETVYIPHIKRHTLCLSTQSGCRMGCPFCVTAKYGYHGNLSAGEIVNQILSLPYAGKITHIVFMGMGEPMDNLQEVLKACNIITAEWGLSISPGNVTVSTVGITPGIKTFLEQSQCNLTVSLYSPFETERLKIIPIERNHPVHEIIEIMKKYPLKKKRRLSIAYLMINNVNDSDRHLERLKQLLQGSGIRVNLLPYHAGINDINTSSSDEIMHYFKQNLVISGVSASIRRSRGADISAACGLLASGY